MAESTLTRNYAALAKEVAHHLGFGTDSSVWSTDETDMIDRALKRGIERFIHPEQNYEWDFMAPVATIALSADTWTYDLPDAFGGVYANDCFTIQTTSSVYVPLEQRAPEQIESVRSQEPSASGIPRYWAVRPKDFSTSEPLRYELLVWPTPDEAYTLRYRYFVLPDMVESGEYPIGGQPHNLTILAYALAEASRMVGEDVTPYEQLAANRLQASIRFDARMKSSRLGYNADRSDNRGLADVQQNYYCTYEGSVGSSP